MHTPVPVHAPDQPVKTELASGFAVNVTVVPLENLALHAEPQLIPGGVLVTVPTPVPAFWTVSSIDEGELSWDEPQPVKEITKSAIETRRETASALVMQTS